MGQHEAGKHSKAGQKRAAEQPRVPKGGRVQVSPTTTTGTGKVYGKPKEN